MKIKIGINGLGRIGRMVVRSIFEEDHSNLKIQHINNRADIETACALLKRDSIHGKFNADISICLLYTSPSPRDRQKSRMPSSA